MLVNVYLYVRCTMYVLTSHSTLFPEIILYFSIILLYHIISDHAVMFYNTLCYNIIHWVILYDTDDVLLYRIKYNAYIL